MSREYPAILNAPDLSKWYFNQMFGLGDPEHNRKVREERENRRPIRSCNGEMALWGIWDKFSAPTPVAMRSSIKNNLQGTQTIPKDILKGKEDLNDETKPFFKREI